MFVLRRITLIGMLKWTRRDLTFYFVLSTLPVCLYFFLDLKWLMIPTLPITLIGTIVAFNLGFKNNNAYDRLWEARKIWGGIVNTSRSWTVSTLDFVGNQFRAEKMEQAELDKIHQKLVYRHLAWLTALRYQLRTERKWEHHKHKDQIKFSERFHTSKEFKESLDMAISPFLSEEEKNDVLTRVNPASSILKNQSQALRELREADLIDDFRHIEMSNLINELFDHQGKSERIKNFPLPRQYATLSYLFVMIFIYILPLGMLSVFSELAAKFGPHYIWLAIPASVVVSWVFFTLEKIGDYSENPFEGTANDVPITSMAKGIEIDLRDMLNEQNLPASIGAENNILT